MKKILLAMTLLMAVTGFTQTRKSPHDTVSTKDITITYGRPYMHGRVIFGELVKYGQVWRLGADEATTISLARDTKFGETTIPAGTYTLFAMVNENDWTFIFNSVLGQWGAFSYEKNKDKDIAQVIVPVGKLATPVEQFTIRFDSDNSIIMEWEQMKIQLPAKPKD
jgi:hypothetical protein